MKLSLATLAAFAIAATLGAGAGVGQGPPASYIVVFKNGVPTDAKTLALQGQMGFTARHRFHAALHGFAAALTGPQLARIQQDTNVAFTSEDRQVQATEAPLAPGETAPTGIRRVNAATTTTTQGTAASVNVAVIDTGIGLSNTDLNVQPGTNCVSPGSAPEDDNGHGTHVSGTIAGKNTGSRVVGVVQRVYYLDRPGKRLMLYDGDRSDLPLVDHVVDLRFTYYVDPAADAVRPPPADGSSCAYAPGTPPVPLLDDLGGLAPTLVPPSRLTDGPVCGLSPHRFDADLLRVRRIGVTVRLETESAALRGSGPAFQTRGTSAGGAKYVPDLQVTFDVAPRNMPAFAGRGH